MKYKKQQWPTDGATIKYVDRKYDRLAVRIDRLSERFAKKFAHLQMLLNDNESLLASLVGAEKEEE